MSLLIKGMEMPVGCWWRDNLGLYRECPLFDRDHYCYKLNREVSDNNAKRPFDCPLAEVPTPHGRLIDADKLEVHDGWLSEAEDYSTHITFVYSNAIDCAPTVIEAEE